MRTYFARASTVSEVLTDSPQNQEMFFSFFVYTKAKTKVKAIEQCQTKTSEEGIRFKFTSPIA